MNNSMLFLALLLMCYFAANCAMNAAHAQHYKEQGGDGNEVLFNGAVSAASLYGLGTALSLAAVVTVASGKPMYGSSSPRLAPFAR
jgi:hypothetical protein